MIKVGNDNISKIYVGEQSIQKAILGTPNGPKVIFDDKSASNWGDWTETVDGRTITHHQSSTASIIRDLQRHRDGIINLHEMKKDGTPVYPGWAIGVERVIELNSIPKRGLESLEGSVWVFKGRRDNTSRDASKSNSSNDTGFFKLQNMSSVPDFSNGDYWKIEFNYYRKIKSKTPIKKVYKIVKLKNGKQQKVLDKERSKYKIKNKWVGKFNGLARVSNLPGAPLCFLKVKGSSHTTTRVYKYSTGTCSWEIPSYSGKKYNLVPNYKAGGKQVFSPYQKIEITGGEDIDNEALINWLKINAKNYASDDDKTTWEVPEIQSSQTVHLVLAHRFLEKNAKDNGYIDGFKLTNWEDNDENGDLYPIFGVVQKEVLSKPGYLCKKTFTDKKNKEIEYGDSTNNWDNTIRRDWLKKGYYRAIKDRQFATKVLQKFTWQMCKGGEKTTTIVERKDKIGLPLQKHIYGSPRKFDVYINHHNHLIKIKEDGCSQEEFNAHAKWEYYNSIERRKKYLPGSNTPRWYWTTSPSVFKNYDEESESKSKYQAYICVNNEGRLSYRMSNDELYFSPIMII